METILIFTTLVLCAFMYCLIYIIDEKQKTIDRLNNEHNAISKENIELRELLEVQDGLLK